MKKTLLQNSEISYEIAKLGHTQALSIGDVGLPIPKGVKCIDLSVSLGIPAFLDVLDAVMSEMEVESVLLAEEIKTRSPDLERKILARLGRAAVSYVPHEEFKSKTADCAAIVRTGEATPYANIILVSGVTF